MKSDDIVRFLYLEYIGSLEFISDHLSKISSEADLDNVVRYSVQNMIRSYGYRTDLFYANFSSILSKILSKSDIFDIKKDKYFGESLTFDVDTYQDKVSSLKLADKTYGLVVVKSSEFGDGGLLRAINIVADEHGWTKDVVHETVADAVEKVHDAAIESLPSVKSSRTYLLSETEKSLITTKIRDLEGIVYASELTQEEKAQASAFLAASLAIAEAPKPNWSMVKELLYLVAAISTTLSLAIQIASLIK